ncbi:DUF1963 domain-containing protein [Actinoallomurus sp. CA-150999]|uniref:DUF1963 domain-containing protein n=1 Tax=Actinoallomurus sp. CA-150999 TaxID=3239887 RepID=UPI003D906AB1
MRYEEALSGVRELCVEHLGEHLGAQVAALARPGFELKPADEDAAVTGLCRWGGPALLEPGTQWPMYAGVPLSVYAVLDVGALGPWLGDQVPATGSALLNFFFLDPWTGSQEVPKDAGGFSYEDPRVCRVVPADSQRAVEVPAPDPAPRFDGVPLHAHPVVTLPSASSYDCDPVLSTLDYGDAIEESSLYQVDPAWLVVDKFGEAAWPQYCVDEQGIEWGGMRNQAFGWPPIHSYGVGLLEDLSQDEPYAHLLTLGATDMWEWGDGGILRFVAPAKAFRAGDMSQARANPDAW